MVEEITTIVTSLGFPSIESFLGAMFLVLAIVGVIVVIATIKPVLVCSPTPIPMHGLGPGWAGCSLIKSFQR